jgi:hypothetical protein
MRMLTGRIGCIQLDHSSLMHANEGGIGEIECFREPLILSQLPRPVDPRQ